MTTGVLFAILATALFNASNLLEKRAVDQMRAISGRRAAEMIRALLGSKLWLMGFAAGVLAVVLMALAYSLAPVAIVQTIYGAGFVVLVVVSRFALREVTGPREWVGLATIVAAAVLVSLTLGSSSFGDVRVSSAAVLGVSLGSITTALALFGALRRSTFRPAITFGVASGLLYGVGGLQTKAASALIHDHGFVGALPLIIGSPYPYVFVAASLLGLVLFQSGLQRSRVAIVGPIANIIGSSFIVALGMALFSQRASASATTTAARVLGFVLVLVGTYVLGTGGEAAVDRAVERRGPGREAQPSAPRDERPSLS